VPSSADARPPTSPIRPFNSLRRFTIAQPAPGHSLRWHEKCILSKLREECAPSRLPCEPFHAQASLIFRWDLRVRSIRDRLTRKKAVTLKEINE